MSEVEPWLCVGHSTHPRDTQHHSKLPSTSHISSKWICRIWTQDFPGGSHGKGSAYNAGDPGSIPGSGRSPGEGNGKPLQYSCLENPMDGGTWQATVLGVAKSRTRHSDFIFTFKSNSRILFLCIVCDLSRAGNACTGP